MERLRTRQPIIEGKLMMIEDKLEINTTLRRLRLRLPTRHDNTCVVADLQIDVVTADNGGTQRRTITTNPVSGDYWMGLIRGCLPSGAIGLST